MQTEKRKVGRKMSELKLKARYGKHTGCEERCNFVNCTLKTGKTMEFEITIVKLFKKCI